MEHHTQAPLMRHALAEHEHAAFVKICVIQGKTKPASPRMGPTLVARGETPRNQIENTHFRPGWGRLTDTFRNHECTLIDTNVGGFEFVFIRRLLGEHHCKVI